MMKLLLISYKLSILKDVLFVDRYDVITFLFIIVTPLLISCGFCLERRRVYLDGKAKEINLRIFEPWDFRWKMGLKIIISSVLLVFIGALIYMGIRLFVNIHDYIIIFGEERYKDKIIIDIWLILYLLMLLVRVITYRKNNLMGKAKRLMIVSDMSNCGICFYTIGMVFPGFFSLIALVSMLINEVVYWVLLSELKKMKL